MIKDHISNAARYAGLPEGFQQALAFLQRDDLGSLECGRVDIAEGVFANIASYEPVPQDRKQYEQHFEYADVQFVVEGSEFLIEAPCDPDDYRDQALESDCALCDDPGSVPSIVHLQAGTFAIVWPGEAHKPGLSDGLFRGTVKKVVVKVRV